MLSLKIAFLIVWKFYHILWSNKVNTFCTKQYFCRVVQRVASPQLPLCTGQASPERGMTGTSGMRRGDAGNSMCGDQERGQTIELSALRAQLQ